MDIKQARLGIIFDIIKAVKSDDNLNRIWRKRFTNNSNAEMINEMYQSFEHAENSVEVLGIKHAT